MKHVLTSSMALLWGLQFAFLTPALALILVDLFDATPADVGWVLAVYNAGGFVASLLIPAYADRKNDYIRPMLFCGVLALALPALLALTTTLPVAVTALIALGGPSGVGMSLLFAHLKHSGASPNDVVNTRAIVSFAWVGGPPLAAYIVGVFGSRAILLALAAIALLNLTATGAAALHRKAARAASTLLHERAGDDGPIPAKLAVIGVVVGFIVLQATDSAAVTIMALFVNERMGQGLIWAGVALGASAALEIPALLFVGRLSRKYSGKALIASGCLAGLAYYAGMTFVADPATLIALQVLHAWFFGVVAGVGLTLFQQIIPRPGLASGLFTNTRRLGAIASGPIIAVGSVSSLGYQGVFAACAILTLAALAIIEMTARGRKQPQLPAESRAQLEEAELP
ncbi:MFS transporter [Arthrobacter sp. StoSoilA2]|uniref:MFS transporter n=1 Tax=Arthrobacter sp. StoSoilA2 TaxID=2830990 RepID=UPI001CC49F82|nr:MFS transporter [Arthrobacter sp. StoSoilA2]